MNQRVSTMEGRDNTVSTLEVRKTPHSISLYWKNIVPTQIVDCDGYTIKYKIKGTKPYKSKHIQNKHEYVCTLKQLAENTDYEIIIFICDDGIDSQIYRTVVKTECSLADLLMKKCDKLGENPVRYILKPSSVKYINKDVRMCYYEDENTKEDYGVYEKKIIVLGQTGSGKSTWLDAMFNYVAGVNCAANYRFQLTHLTESEKNKQNIQILSQTDGITCYHVPLTSGSVIDFKLCVIDTPGFGDCRGTDFDDTIPTKINALFSEHIESLHAICLVVKLSDVRLSESQRYVFTKIMELFGKNVKDNICALVTYDDSGTGELPVLKSIEESGIQIADGAFFRFNNSGIFNESSSEMAQLVWKERTKNFEKFFKKLRNMTPISLKCTKEVLEKKEKLSTDLQHTAIAVRESVNKFLQFNQDKAQLMKFESQMRDNKPFEVRKRVINPGKTEKSYNSLNCTFCSKTCHNSCMALWPYSVSKLTCNAISYTMKCRYCGCSAFQHEIQGYIHSTIVTEEIETDTEMKKRYDVADKGVESYKIILQKAKTNIHECLISLDEKLATAYDLITILNHDAMKSEYKDIIDFLDHIIKQEEEELKDKDQESADLLLENVKMLHQMKCLKKDKKPLTDLAETLGIGSS